MKLLLLASLTIFTTACYKPVAIHALEVPLEWKKPTYRLVPLQRGIFDCEGDVCKMLFFDFQKIAHNQNMCERARNGLIDMIEGTK
jgi:hypothetical protein